MEAVAEGVRVWGARGRPATPTYKISATFMDGYKVGYILYTSGSPLWKQVKAGAVVGIYLILTLQAKQHDRVSNMMYTYL